MQKHPEPTATRYYQPQFSPQELVLEDLWQWRKHGHWWDSEDTEWRDDLTAPARTTEDWEHFFSKIASLLLKGLRMDAIQDALTTESVPFEPSERPLSLLRKIVKAREADGTVEKLSGLAYILTLGPEAGREEPPDAQAPPFEALCNQLEEELRAIFRALDHRYRYLAAKYG